MRLNELFAALDLDRRNQVGKIIHIKLLANYNKVDDMWGAVYTVAFIDLDGGRASVRNRTNDSPDCEYETIYCKEWEVVKITPYATSYGELIIEIEISNR